MRIFSFPFAATIAALMLSGCTASASLGPATTPTPAPFPTPQPPQVIYVQSPAPAPQSTDDYSLKLFVIMALMVAGSSAIATTFYFVGWRNGKHESTQANKASYSASMYQVTLTPAEFNEWQQLQAYKARQMVGNNRQVEVRR